jgi:hypothetical protein
LPTAREFGPAFSLASRLRTLVLIDKPQRIAPRLEADPSPIHDFGVFHKDGVAPPEPSHAKVAQNLRALDNHDVCVPAGPDECVATHLRVRDLQRVFASRQPDVQVVGNVNFHELYEIVSPAHVDLEIILYIGGKKSTAVVHRRPVES